MDPIKTQANALALDVLKHRLGRAVMPFDFLLHSRTISETADNIANLIKQGIPVTLAGLIEALDECNETCGGGDGPRPE
jgi:hypothetical protein